LSGLAITAGGLIVIEQLKNRVPPDPVQVRMILDKDRSGKPGRSLSGQA